MFSCDISIICVMEVMPKMFVFQVTAWAARCCVQWAADRELHKSADTSAATTTAVPVGISLRLSVKIPTWIPVGIRVRRLSTVLSRRSLHGRPGVQPQRRPLLQVSAAPRPASRPHGEIYRRPWRASYRQIDPISFEDVHSLGKEHTFGSGNENGNGPAVSCRQSAG